MAQRIITLILFVTSSTMAMPYAVMMDSDLPLYKRVATGIAIELGESDSENPSVMIAIGPKSTAAAIKNHKKTPVIYCMVPSLENYKFVQLNTVGIRLEYNYEKQLGMLQSVFPDIKRVGVLYHPQKSKAEVARAQAAAGRVGLMLIVAKLGNPESVPKALATLQGQVDALWMLSDPVALHISVVEQSIKFALEQKLPFLALDDGFVAQGALMSFATDYVWVGRQAGRLANRIVSEGISQHIVEPEGLNIALNMTTMAQFDTAADVSLNLLNYAAEHQFKVETFRALP